MVKQKAGGLYLSNPGAGETEREMKQKLESFHKRFVPHTLPCMFLAAATQLPHLLHTPNGTFANPPPQKKQQSRELNLTHEILDENREHRMQNMLRFRYTA